MVFSDSDDIDGEKQKKKQKQNAKKSSDTESSVTGTKYIRIRIHTRIHIYDRQKFYWLVSSVIFSGKNRKEDVSRMYRAIATAIVTK